MTDPERERLIADHPEGIDSLRQENDTLRAEIAHLRAAEATAFRRGVEAEKNVAVSYHTVLAEMYSRLLAKYGHDRPDDEVREMLHRRSAAAIDALPLPEDEL